MEKYNEDPQNFILVEAFKIFTGTRSKILKLAALWLIHRIASS